MMIEKHDRNFGLWCLLGLVLSWLVGCNSAPSPSMSQELEFWTMQLQPQFTQ